MALYVLVEHVHKSVARAMLILVALSTGIICLDAVFQFLLPELGQAIHAFIVLPSAVAEISMVLYLLVVGVRTVEPGGRTVATA